MPSAIRKRHSVEERSYEFNHKQRQEHMLQLFQRNNCNLAALQPASLL